MKVRNNRANKVGEIIEKNVKDKYELAFVQEYFVEVSAKAEAEEGIREALEKAIDFELPRKAAERVYERAGQIIDDKSREVFREIMKKIADSI